MEVLAHEVGLLRSGGHDVEEYTLPPVTETGLDPVRSGLKAVWNRDAFHEVQRLAREFKPDVLHVHTPFPTMSPAVFQATHRLNIPAVTTLHSYRYSCIAGTCFRNGTLCEDCVGKSLKLPGMLHRCYHDSLGASSALTLSLALHKRIGTFHQAVDRYIALTDFAKGLLARDGIPSDKIVVKPNSVPDPGDLPGPGDQSPYLVFVGRLIDIKGVRTLLDAWAVAAPTALRLCIAGDGPLRGLVQQRAEQDSTIEFTGWVDEPAVRALMAGAEAVVVPSEWYEGGQPLVLLHSLAAGTPVIASDLPNVCGDVVTEGAGLSFAVAEPGSLAEVISKAAAQPGALRAMRPAARRLYLERHSPAANLHQLEHLYRQVVDERARSPQPRG
jgi:glycosyltransferase involved in cell wall biosynthesis